MLHKNLRYLPLQLLFITIGGCGFKSHYEAAISCQDWSKQGGSYTGVIKAIPENNKDQTKKYLYQDTTNNFPLKTCKKDKYTNQILGFKVINRDLGKTYIFNQSYRVNSNPYLIKDRDLKLEIEKRFKF